ncbi:MAG: hypothetical protein MUP81_02530 [Dehalococcoidia bacterium]|nr:hypothetical protein [Dehalococcoidia bacterium]
MRDRDAIQARNRAESARAINPDRPAADVLPNGAWAGQPCFIIGGGPSLMGFDFERLRGRGRVIAINKAYLYMPFADVVFFMDHASFYMYLKRKQFGADALKAWDDFKGLRIFLNLRGRDVPDAYSIRSIGRVGLPTSLKNGLYHGNNSGFGAIGVAICAGADPIYLLGYDLKHQGGVTHFHGGYGRRQPEVVMISYKKGLTELAHLVAKRGWPKIINLNPASALTAFPFGTIDEVLK